MVDFSLLPLLAFRICLWQRTSKLQSFGSSCFWAFHCFAMDSKGLSSISDCFGDQITNKNTKTYTKWLEMIEKVLNMLIGLKGDNYYSKVFKRVNYKLSNSTFWVVIKIPYQGKKKKKRGSQLKNKVWPSYFPIIHNDIANKIPVDAQSHLCSDWMSPLICCGIGLSTVKWGWMMLWALGSHWQAFFQQLICSLTRRLPGFGHLPNRTQDCILEGISKWATMYASMCIKKGNRIFHRRKVLPYK